jgi:hypothetical protein
MRTLVTILVAAIVLLPLTAGDFTETRRMMLVK